MCRARRLRGTGDNKQAKRASGPERNVVDGWVFFSWVVRVRLDWDQLTRLFHAALFFLYLTITKSAGGGAHTGARLLACLARGCVSSRETGSSLLLWARCRETTRVAVMSTGWMAHTYTWENRRELVGGFWTRVDVLGIPS